MILIVCDSLRYDFAKEYMDDIFLEQTFSKIHTLDTRTPLNLPTMYTGLPKEEHKSLHPWEPVQYDDCLFDHFKSWVTVSRYLGTARDYTGLEMPIHKIIKKSPTPFMYHPLPFNSFSMNDNDIFECVSLNERHNNWDLINYWSWITHTPYGITNQTSKTCSAIKDERRLLERLSKPDREKWYTLGVKEMRDRIRSIANMTNDIIIVTSDHGEALGEDGIYGHPRLGEGGKLYPPLAEVPFIVNRKVNVPNEFKQTELKDIVVRLKYE